MAKVKKCNYSKTSKSPNFNKFLDSVKDSLDEKASIVKENNKLDTYVNHIHVECEVKEIKKTLIFIVHENNMKTFEQRLRDYKEIPRTKNSIGGMWNKGIKIRTKEVFFN